MVTYDARPSAFTQLTTTSEWEYLFTNQSGINAVDASVGSAMNPSLDTGGRNAVIADGVVVVKGQLWRCDAPVNTPIPAASAQNRIDRLVIRLTRGATTSPTVVAPVIIAGTPSGSPVIPPIVQTPTGIWDIPISHWTATSAGGLTGLVDDRLMANDPCHDMRPLASGLVGTIASELPPQYTYDAQNGVVLVFGAIATPASGTYNGQIFYTFPPAYRPPVAQGWPVVQTASSASADTTGGFPRAFVDPTGALTVNGLSPSMFSSTVRINGFFALNSPGLILS